MRVVTNRLSWRRDSATAARARLAAWKAALAGVANPATFAPASDSVIAGPLTALAAKSRTSRTKAIKKAITAAGGAADVALEATAGQILQGAVGERVKGNNVTLTADTGIGATGAGNAVETASTNLAAKSTTSGAIFSGVICCRRATRSFSASVSVGISNGVPVLDLDYAEDSSAETDMNVVMNNAGHFVEVQGTAEGHAFRREELNALLDLAHRLSPVLFRLHRGTPLGVFVVGLSLHAIGL